MDIEERIEKDIAKFNDSIKKFENFDSKIEINYADLRSIFELAKMYALDSRSWLVKKDYYTAFASISYAHGLLDSLLKLLKVE
ncbi:MAG: DUF357 domain-containing protein [Candidatus Micrarchaeia archaeon]